uniref:Mu-like prophage protein gp16 n=1 Tax=Candidatus Kentrum sp. UNK TaxID=2126344 RepID=A0A451ARG4_9GAMM|nr:MAG: Protein of unknown function (DUF1018) [Candidatus Kentron sp. UNK]VFK68639.1 MAG: Protein of unknown function (DUF1018) [Candidatus Kentron sp. UNK]
MKTHQRIDGDSGNDRNNALARIHMIIKALGMEEDTYRALLRDATGKDSARDLSPRERNIVLSRLEDLARQNEARTPHWPLPKDAPPRYRAIRAKCFALGVGNAYALEILRRMETAPPAPPARLEDASDAQLGRVLGALRAQEAREGSG